MELREPADGIVVERDDLLGPRRAAGEQLLAHVLQLAVELVQVAGAPALPEVTDRALNAQPAEPDLDCRCAAAGTRVAVLALALRRAAGLMAQAQ